MDKSDSTTRQKALAINLDATTYGTFAQIGGGHEVARWFFLVGGAARTVAKNLRDLLLEIGRIVPIHVCDESLLSIHTPEVLERIQRQDPNWKAMVPAVVAEAIKTKNLFGLKSNS
jgi:hypothetical protein